MRTHLSKTNNPIILREVMATDRGTGCYKPSGFWYEVDGDWRRWCEGEGFGSYEHIHSVELNDCNVLLVDSLSKLDEFHAEFAEMGLRRYYSPSINWKAVSELYDGIEIAPYQWERRLKDDFSWYYGWDCASGVIWNPRNASVSYIGVYEPKSESAVTA